MKIVLSRKGCDSAAGKLANVVLPDGTIAMLPIPEGHTGSHARSYQHVNTGAQSLGPLVHDLSKGRITPNTLAHLDPDLDVGSVPRAPGWKPLFGQSGIAERHLQRMGVDVGDLFVFWGWFRPVVQNNGRWRYVPGNHGVHAFFGWLQVEQRIDMAQRIALPPWVDDHPHAQRPTTTQPDSVYISADRLHLPGFTIDAPGAGMFRHFDPALCLSAPGRSRSYWRLPAWFHPEPGRPPLTYHADRRRWTRTDDAVILRSAAQGQEFVLDADAYPEAVPWIGNLIERFRHA
jgi:hypothetical protein